MVRTIALMILSTLEDGILYIQGERTRVLYTASGESRDFSLAA